MDLRDIFRGFFGLPSQRPTDSNPRSDPPKHFPPSQGFIENEDEERDPFSRFPGSMRRPALFGDMFSVLEDMFRDMEQSMQDLDEIFDASGFQSQYGFDKSTNTLDPPPLPKLNKSDDQNIRDMVLKYDDKPSRNTYIAKSEKVDKDLDELYNSSKLDISELPLPKRGSSQIMEIPEAPAGPAPRMRNSTFERVYSTYSFNNGKWEGRTVREDDAGKEITSFSKNEKGEVDKITEFFPKDGTLNPTDFDENRTTSLQPPMSIFERLFKPRL